MKTALITAILLACSTFLINCASYKLGSPSTNNYSKIHISPVKNDSTYPLLEASLTQSLRAAINQTGKLSCTSIDSAERQLDVKVINAKRRRLAIQAQDLGRGKKFGLEITLLFSLYDLENDKTPVFQNKELTISQDIFVDSDLTTANAGNQIDAEYLAGPEISKKLATRITEALTDLW